MKIKRFKLCFLLAVLIAFSASHTMAQHYCSNSKWSSSADTQWWNYDTPAENALTAKQITQMNELRNNSNKNILLIENELQSLRTKYQALNSSPDIDIPKLKSLRKDIRDKEEKIEDINLETKVQIKKLLNKEQLMHFNSNKYIWWDMTESCWYSANTEVNSRKQAMRSRCNSHCW